MQHLCKSRFLVTVHANKGKILIHKEIKLNILLRAWTEGLLGPFSQSDFDFGVKQVIGANLLQSPSHCSVVAKCKNCTLPTSTNATELFVDSSGLITTVWVKFLDSYTLHSKERFNSWNYIYMFIYK